MCSGACTGKILAISDLQPNFYVHRQPQRDVPVPMLLEPFKPLAHVCEATTEEGNVRVTVTGAVITKLPVTAVPKSSGGVAASTAETE
jgi:hypothetical protein